MSSLERVTQTLVAPPALPQHEQVASGDPKVVQIRMVVSETEAEIAPGVFIWAFTFNGSVPGPIAVVHEGDYVELTLVNPSNNELLHNIDFHAASGALGGGALTHVGTGARGGLALPGDQSPACSSTIVPLRGDGALARYPRHEWRHHGAAPGRAERPGGHSITYDRAYYIGEQDYYIPQDAEGNFKRYDTPSASLGRRP